MSQPPAEPSSQVHGWRRRLVVGIKFVFLGLPGLVVFLVSSFRLALPLSGPQANRPHLALTVGFAALGLMLMLLGVGLSARPRYALVFVSIPVSIWLYSVLDITLVDPKLDPAAIVGIVAFLTYHGVRRSYG